MKGKVVHLGKIITEGRVIKQTIYGYGEFATRDYKANDVVYTCEISMVPDDVSHYTFETSEGLYIEDKPELYYVPVDGHFYRYSDQLVNHSCNPNLVAKTSTFPTNGSSYASFEMIALRDIKSGEELTYDYNLCFWEFDSSHSFTCLCGSQSCYGKIEGFKFLSKELQENKIKFADKIVADEYYASQL